VEPEFAENRAAYRSDGLSFFDRLALLERLSRALKKRSQDVVFLVGAPLSAPATPAGPGVPGVAGVIALIEEEFEDDPLQMSALMNALEGAGSKRYQVAFEFVQGRRGQRTVNEIVRKAVLAARVPASAWASQAIEVQDTGDDVCRRLEADSQGWELGRGIEYLGRLVAEYPQRFGTCILTTNFDPLIEVAIRRAGGCITGPSFTPTAT
jgi:hypothetical protein